MVLPYINPNEKVRIRIRFGTAEKKVISGNTDVCMIKAPSIKMAYISILFISFLYFNRNYLLLKINLPYPSVDDTLPLLSMVDDPKLGFGHGYDQDLLKITEFTCGNEPS